MIQKHHPPITISRSEKKKIGSEIRPGGVKKDNRRSGDITAEEKRGSQIRGRLDQKRS